MKFQEDIRNGGHGKTAQFRLTLYLDLMRMQQLAHKTVQINNFGLRLVSWKYFLPFCFALNKQNYARHGARHGARYGAFYVKVLENIATVSPGLKEITSRKDKNITVYVQRPIKEENKL